MKQIETNDVQLISSTQAKKLGVSLTPDNEAHMFNVLINMYSNPIRAVVQELCSNAYDESTQFRCGVENGMFYVQDYGKGMSPEFFDEVFLNILSSTKREDETKLGKFGIGSKSPLAYTDNYTIVTVSGGIKYTYTIIKTDKTPSVIPIGQEDAGIEVGTRIIVPLKSDEYAWNRALKDVLQLFDGAYVNDEQIKVNKVHGYPVLDTNLRVALGPVIYNLDWSHFPGYEWLSPVPYAIVLPLTGEVGPSPSRESLIYTDLAIKTITQGLKGLEENVLLQFEEQMKATSFVSKLKILRANFTKIELDKTDTATSEITIQKKITSLPKFHAILVASLTEAEQAVLNNPIQYKELNSLFDVSNFCIYGKKRGYSTGYWTTTHVPVAHRKLVGSGKLYRFTNTDLPEPIFNEVVIDLAKANHLVSFSEANEGVIKAAYTLYRRTYGRVENKTYSLDDSSKSTFYLTIAYTRGEIPNELVTVLPACGISIAKFTSKKAKQIGVTHGMIDALSLTTTQKGIVRRLVRKAHEIKAYEVISPYRSTVYKNKECFKTVDPVLYDVLMEVINVDKDGMTYDEADEVINLGKKLGIVVPKVEYNLKLIQKHTELFEIVYIAHNSYNTSSASETIKTYYDILKRKDFIIQKSKQLGYDSTQFRYQYGDDSDSFPSICETVNTGGDDNIFSDDPSRDF